MKTAVMGTGAMACLLGGRMIQGGNDVVFVSNWKENIEVLNKKGLCIIDGNTGQEEHISVRACSSADDALYILGGKPDVILIMCKGPQTEKTTYNALPLADEGTLFLSLQNGLGNDEIIAAIAGSHRVFYGSASIAALIPEPGAVRDNTNRNRSPLISVLPCDAMMDERLGRISELCSSMGYSVLVGPGAEKNIWNKLAINCCANAISAVTRLQNGVYSENENGQSLIARICEEVAAVGIARGIDTSAEALNAYCRKTFHGQMHLSSTLQDVLHHRPTEIDFISGAIVKEGKKYGIPTPVCETMYELVKCISDNYEKMQGVEINSYM